MSERRFSTVLSLCHGCDAYAASSARDGATGWLGAICAALGRISLRLGRQADRGTREGTLDARNPLIRRYFFGISVCACRAGPRIAPDNVGSPAYANGCEIPSFLIPAPPQPSPSLLHRVGSASGIPRTGKTTGNSRNFSVNSEKQFQYSCAQISCSAGTENFAPSEQRNSGVGTVEVTIFNN